MKILGISGTLVGSKPAVLVKDLLQRVQQYIPEAQVELLDVKQYQLDFCDGRPLESYSEDTQKLAQKVQEADAFIIGTTILHGTMPGTLKNIFELVPIPAFEKKCVLFAANGGNHLHYLAVENYIKPVANYLNMFVLPQYAFVLSSEFTSQNEVNDEKAKELNRLAQDFAQFTKQLTFTTKEEIV